MTATLVCSALTAAAVCGHIRSSSHRKSLFPCKYSIMAKDIIQDSRLIFIFISSNQSYIAGNIPHLMFNLVLCPLT